MSLDHHLGHHFQESVCTFLERKFGKAVNKWKGLPDIQVVVNGVKLNLEVTTSTVGFWWKELEYKERGIILHAFIVASPPINILDSKVPIFLFDENLSEKLIEIARRV